MQHVVLSNKTFGTDLNEKSVWDGYLWLANWTIQAQLLHLPNNNIFSLET